MRLLFDLFIDKPEYDGAIENLPAAYFGKGSWMNTENWRRSETFSANVSASARGLSKLGKIMANRGVSDGKRYMSKRGWREFHSGKDTRLDEFIGYPTTFTDGGASVDHLSEGFYGWDGFGGSVFVWNPELNISFSYVPTDLYPGARWARGKMLLELTKECVMDMDMDDDMGDDNERIEMDGFGSIEMGSDGEGDYLIIRMGAQKLAATAVASVLAGLALY